MLAEGESLFVEHKADIAKGEGFQLSKAAASFANTMGGWILVGVRHGCVDPSWVPPRGEFVDAVRQRFEGLIDPLPSFAAGIVESGGGKVGVVRVYESADTPHLLSDGSVVVREPAQDAKLRKRGETAVRAAEARFRDGSHPLIESAHGLHSPLRRAGARVGGLPTASTPA